jgi:hypothetical protein
MFLIKTMTIFQYTHPRERLLVGIAGLVTRREYSHEQASDWSYAENLFTSWHRIGHMHRIFPQAGIGLVATLELRHSPDNHTQRIFPRAGIGLVTCREYSHELALDWSHAENIPTSSHWIGHMQRIFQQAGVRLVATLELRHGPNSHKHRIFPQAGVGLVTCREYSYELALDWSHAENIPTRWHWIGSHTGTETRSK